MVLVLYFEVPLLALPATEASCVAVLPVAVVPVPAPVSFSVPIVDEYGVPFFAYLTEEIVC